MTSQKNLVVVKSNRLVEASYRLNINEHRLILYAICKAREEDKALTTDQPITITADAFLRRFPIVGRGNVYQQLKSAMESLYERSVTIHDTDPSTGFARVKKTRWVSEAAYIDGAGNVQVIFAPEVIKYIARLELEFTPYKLEIVGKMTSSYAVRIYELLRQNLTIGSRTMKLTWLRDVLQLEPGEYKLTADFKKWVLDVAVAQIKKHSDLDVDYTSEKTGRAITAFVFTIKRKDGQPNTAPLTDQQLRERLEANGQQRLDEYDPAEEF